MAQVPAGAHDMLENLLAPKFIVLYAFAASAIYVHYRGRVRHRFFRQLTDHSSIMAPYNALMYLFSAVPNRPYVDVARFPELAPLRDNWQTIRDEALRLVDQGHIRAATKFNDIGFNSFYRTGWKRFYVKWYDAPPPSARAFCPRTVALVESIPCINGAMFALLPAGGYLGAHRDPYAGSLRYHLGLVTPNSEACRLVVDGEPYAWRDGEAVVFDETYMHHAENKTATARIILFCDIERPLSNRVIATMNRWFRNTMIRASQTENVEGDKVGFLNRIFGVAYRVRLQGKRLKAFSRLAYYALKWAVFGGFLVGVFVLL
jgi:beta-hydroxylase